MNYYKVLLAMCLICNTCIAFAQGNSRDEIKADNQIQIYDTGIRQDSTKLHVDYNLKFGKRIVSCRVKPTLLVDNGATDIGVYQGDCGTIKSPGRKSFTCDVSEFSDSLVGHDISFLLKARPDYTFMVLTTFNPVAMSFGLNIGFLRKGFGGYASFSLSSLAIKPDNAAFWVTSGLLIRSHKNVYPYFGAGIGYDCYDPWWKEEREYDGWEIWGARFECGVILKFGKFALSAGVGTLQFERYSCDIGIGMMF